MSEVLQEYRLLVPNTMNDGSPVSAKLRVHFERRMCCHCGGFTVVRNAEGRWYSPTANEFRDGVDIYFLATSDENTIFALAFEIGRLLAQQAIYAVLPNNCVVIVPIDDETARDGDTENKEVA